MKSKKNKRERKIRNKKRAALKKKKQVATTLEWCDIEEIRQKCIILKRGKKRVYVKGVKLTPHNIFISTPQKQGMIINDLRIVLNQLSMKLYWGFVFTPVDMGMYFAKLQEEIRNEEDPSIRSLMQSQYEKGCWFCDTHKEISFEIFVQGSDEKDLYKQYDKLIQEFNANGFRLKEMSNADYEDYLAYMFENEMINDFYFSRGIFSCLQEEDVSMNRNAIEYEPDWELNLLEEEYEE